jgi:hypothetical protein
MMTAPGTLPTMNPVAADRPSNASSTAPITVSRTVSRSSIMGGAQAVARQTAAQIE